MHSGQTRAEKWTKLPQIELPKWGVKFLPRGDKNWLGNFSYCKKQAQIFRANFGTDFGKIFGPDFIKFRDQLRARFRGLLWPLEKAGNPSAPVRPWGVQTAGNRQDLPALNHLEQTLLLCLLRLR